MFMIFGILLIVGIFKPEKVIPWKLATDKRRLTVISVHLWGSLISLFSVFLTIANPWYPLIAWLFWGLIVYLQYKDTLRRRGVDTVIESINNFSPTKTIKVHDTTIASDEKLEQSYIVRGEIFGKNTFKEKIENFVPSKAYNLSKIIFAIDNNRRKTCVISGLDKIKFYMLDDFTPVEEYATGNCVFSIDYNAKKVCIIDNGSTPKIFMNTDIISVEIAEDEDTITKTQRSSQIARAVVGNVLAGGVGAIIGGLSGSKRTTGIVKSVVVKLIVNDIQQPNISMTFLSKETKRGSSAYKNALELAEKWYGMFRVLINMADKEEKIEVKQQVNQPIPQNDKPVSMADELQKLVALRDSGAISAEEFDTLKGRIISA